MARFCSECGNPIADGFLFCSQCGTKAVDDVAPVVEAAPVVETPVAEAPVVEDPVVETPLVEEPFVYTEPETPYVPQYADPEPAPVPTYKAVSTGAYFWLLLLFSIPVIGFISCIIFSFAPKNASLKHFARAILIWMLICLIVTGICVGILALLANTLLAYVSNMTDGYINSMTDVVNLAEELFSNVF